MNALFSGGFFNFLISHINSKNSYLGRLSFYDYGERKRCDYNYIKRINR